MTQRGRITTDEAMAAHVSWQAGGVAKQAYWPADTAELSEWLKGVGDEALLFVGAGTNLLVRDGGFSGAVVFTRPGLTARVIEGEAPAKGFKRVYVEAGVSGAELADFAAEAGLTGLEFLAGIPGTLGGALIGNAGCFSSETWDSVAKVKLVNRRGELIERSPGEFDIGYRQALSLEAREEWFIGAWFDLRERDGSLARQTIAEFLSKRVASQPLSQANAGRVFRNPPGLMAATLIEQAGMAGKRCGDAQVAAQQTNFIVNRGKASAADIEALIGEIRQAVKDKFGVDLKVEATIVGAAK